jgi:hypothetical protein
MEPCQETLRERCHRVDGTSEVNVAMISKDEHQSRKAQVGCHHDNLKLEFEAAANVRSVTVRDTCQRSDKQFGSL